jgi:iron complex transport system substrate-binding protein
MRWLFPALLCFSVSVQAEIRVTDDAGRLLVLRAPAQRVVSLAPHATELLFAAGAGGQVVGVSELSTWPEVARQLPPISSGVRVDMERALALRPDLVVAWLSGNSRVDLDRFVALRIPVFIAEPKKLEALPETLLNLGRLTGHETDAKQAGERYRSELEKLRAEYRDRKPVRVFLQISTQPLMTLNYNHLASDILMLCGGRNIFAASELIAPDVSMESVVLEDPDAILFSDALGTVAELNRWWKERGASLRAVHAGRVYGFSGEKVLRQGSRVLEGARQLCTQLDAARTSLASEKE